MDQPNFTVTTENLDSNSGKFIIEPLPQGYGDTLGNALRRVLYTSIHGSAITSVKFSGVRHQFTSIEGVAEDVVQIVLALKQVRPGYNGEKPVQIRLSAKGVGEVKAGDFEVPAEVTIANPDLVIAHLTDKNAVLELEATVETGYGYSPAEERSTTTVGVIPTDASYSPVVRVNYSVESTRVGRVTNFDKLTLEIITDGTVAPQDALMSASSNLVGYFSAVAHPQSATLSGGVSAVSASRQPGSTISVEELDLPTRISNALQKAGFDSVASLLSTPREELAKVKNLGGKSVKIIELALKERGFEFAS
jgi:DNA-directed RNA polymerase subunit alpha